MDARISDIFVETPSGIKQFDLLDVYPTFEGGLTITPYTVLGYVECYACGEVITDGRCCELKYKLDKSGETYKMHTDCILITFAVNQGDQ